MSDKPQFSQATKNIMNSITCDPHDERNIRCFLREFAEHVVSNIALIDLERLTAKEIVARIPDMELAE